MSPNDASYTYFNFSSSETSDSDSFLEQDIKNCESELNKQWEAIERTLYQEDGEQVTDPELLRECKLWRDTFPHMRVKGTKIDNPNPQEDAESEDEDTSKTIQTANNIDLKKLSEKREKIKNKIVDALVEKIMHKFSLNNENEKSSSENDVQITELVGEDDEEDDEEAEKPKSRTSDSEEESYYERGKDSERDKIDAEETMLEMVGEWSVQDATPSKSTERLLKPPLISNYPEGMSKKSERRIPSSDPMMKPFEISKKIDKKYEGLLDRIVERRFTELEPVCSLQEIRGYRESIEKLRVRSGMDKSLRRNRNFPRLNKFSNNWLDRGELHARYNKIEKPSSKHTRSAIHRTTERDHGDEIGQEEMDEYFIRDVRKEMMKKCKRPPNRSGVVEEISLRRPQPYTTQKTPEGTQKSLSCGDLLKRNKKLLKGNQKEVLPIGQTRIKSNKLTQNNKLNNSTTKNGLLPPIETGIICTELKITPKGRSGQKHKKY